MGYQVLARKYRPQRFSDVAGQDHVTRTLINALTQKRIAHGYIFSGHRGIGKTTIARILAMALDCRTEVGSPDRPTVEPCLHCVSCREISSGGNAEGDTQATHSFDFIEIDAASNRGIDDVRSICSQANVRPARDRYKIFLLDEAHQITDAAFNAILKTLEEPPDWAIFMMATTEPESIPQTIRSRCQHFSFHAVKFDDIVTQLRMVAGREDIDAEDAALALLAEAGDGSMRDALSIMDQAIASAPLVNGRPVLQVDQIRELMGTVPNAVFERLLDAVSAGQSAELMDHLNRLLNSGNSPTSIARQMVRYLRNCLMSKIGGPSTQLLEVAQDERDRAARTAQLFSEEELTRNLQIILRTFDELNYRQEQRFHLELGMLKMVHAQRLLPVEEILSGLASQGPRRALPSSAPARPAPPPSRPNPPAPAAAPSLSPFASTGSRPDPRSDIPDISGFSSTSTSARRDTPAPTSSVTRTAQPEATLSPFAVSSASYSTGSAAETVTEGALARAAETQAEALPSAPELRLGPSIVPPLQDSAPALIPEPVPEPQAPAPAARQSAPTATAGLASLTDAVVKALEADNHSSAAVIIAAGRWSSDGGSVRIEVPAKPTMIRITFNAEAEKIIRRELVQAGHPSRFAIVPGEGLAPAGTSRASAPVGSIENEARNHPLVTRALDLFEAEIVSVIDLRPRG